MKDEPVMRVGFRRRELLAGTALLLLTGFASRAAVVQGQLPWAPNAGNPPVPARPGPWAFFTGAEGRAVEAMADRIIPPDPQTPGGKDAGCAVFVDRQLAGAYGAQEGLYVRPPFIAGSKSQGSQSEGGPRKEYREGLAALDRACQVREGGKRFADLADDRKDQILKDLEEGTLRM